MTTLAVIQNTLEAALIGNGASNVVKTTINGREIELAFKRDVKSETFGIVGMKAAVGKADLGGLGDLSELVGGADLDFLPAHIPVVDDLSLSEIELIFEISNKQLLSINVALASGQPWTIVEKIFVIDPIKLEFCIDDPTEAEQRSISCTVFGLLDIGGVKLNATLTSAFGLRAELGPDETIDLTLIARHVLGTAVGIPDLRLTQLGIDLEPQEKSYSLLGALTTDWHICTLGSTSVDLKEIAFELTGSPDGLAARLTGDVSIGPVDFTVSANHPGPGQGWEFSGATGPDAEIHLDGLLQALSPLGISAGSNLPSISVHGLGMTFNSAEHSLEFHGDVSVSGSNLFDGVGDELHGHIEFTRRKNDAGKQSLTGELQVEMPLGDAVFSVTMSMKPEDKLIRATWDGTKTNATIGISDVIDAMGADAVVPIPDGLDIRFVRATIEYHSDRKTLLFSAQTADHNQACLVVGRAAQTQQWHVIFGLHFENAGHLSDIPVVGDVFTPADFLNFKSVSLLASNADVKKFAFPDMPALPADQPDENAPSVEADDGDNPPTRDLSQTPRTNHPVRASMGPVAVQLSKGASLVAVLDLDDDGGDEAWSTMTSVLERDQLTIQAGIGVREVSLAAALDGTVSFGPLTLSDPRVGIDFVSDPLKGGAMSPMFRLEGSLRLVIMGHPVNATGSLIASSNMMQGAAMVDLGGLELPGPGILHGVHIEKFGVELGQTFQPPEPPAFDFGIQGQFHIGKYKSDKIKFAMAMEIIEDVPNPILLSFAALELDLAKGFTAVADEDPPGGVKNVLEMVKAEDLSFFWAEKVFPLPDGTTASPGLSFRGNIDLFGFQAYADFKSNASGVSGHAEFEAIDIKVLKISGTGKGITGKQQLDEATGQWLPIGAPPLVRENPKSDKQLQVRDHVYVPPGGPFFQFQTGQSPYVKANAKVELMGLLSSSLDLVIDNDGMKFHFKESLGPAELKLDCTVNAGTPLVLAGNGSFDCHLKGNLPEIIPGLSFTAIHLDVGFDAAAGLHLVADVEHPERSKFALTLNGSIGYGLGHFSMPQLTIDVPIGDIADIASRLWDHIVDNVEEIFGALFDAARLVYEKMKQAVEFIGEQAEQAGKAIVKGAGELADGIEKGAEKLAHAAEQAVDDAAELGKKTAKLLSDTTEKVAGIVSDTARVVAYLDKQGLEFLGNAEHQAAKLVSDAVAAFSDVVNKAGEALATAARWAEGVIGDAYATARQAFETAKRIANQAIALARRVAQDVLHEAERVLNTIGETLGDLGEGVGGLTNKSGLGDLGAKSGGVVLGGLHSIGIL